MSDAEERRPLRRFRSAADDDSVFTPGVLIRLQYAAYLFCGLAITMLFQGAMQGMFSEFDFLRKGCQIAAETSEAIQKACASEVMVYRVSFSLAVFFLLHWLSVSDLTCCVKSTARAQLQESFFTAKTVVLVLIFIGTLFMPNSFFAGYAYLCLFSSVFFLLLNVVFLVDFAYQWSDDWGARAEENPKWMYYLLLVAVASYAAAAVVAGASVYLFVPHSDCNFNAFAVTAVIVAALLYTVCSIYVPHGSIVPSGIVFLYTASVLCFTLRMTPGEHCNRLAPYTAAGSGGASIKQMLLSTTVSSFTLGYAVVSSGGSWAALNIGSGGNNDNEDGEGEYDGGDDPDRSGHLSQYMFFYFIMMLGSMYLAMLATDWHVSGAGAGQRAASRGIAFWARAATVLLAAVLYLWSLLAPYTCCRDRDFGFDTDGVDIF